MMDALFDLGPPDFTGSWLIREVTHETATSWIASHHYLGQTPASATSRLGVFCPDLMGLVVYARPTNASGVARRYDLERWVGNLEIARVAVHPEAPRNTASKLIAATNTHIHKGGVDWVFSYADTAQGHHGGIYQALNAIYVGRSPGSAGYLVDGEPVHPRTMIARFGTRALAALPRLAEESGTSIEYVVGLNSDKHTYILPVGGPAVRRAIRQHLASRALPYPKREPAAEAAA